MATSNHSLEVAQQAFRKYDLVGIPAGVTLPKRCIFCNNEAIEPPIKISLTNNSAARQFPSVVGGAIGGAIAGSMAPVRTFRTKGYLCVDHWGDRARFTRIVAVTIILTVLVLAVLASFGYLPVGLAVSFCVLIGLAIYAKLNQKRLLLHHFEGNVAYAHGAGQAFLASLPPAPT